MAIKKAYKQQVYTLNILVAYSAKHINCDRFSYNLSR